MAKTLHQTHTSQSSGRTSPLHHKAMAAADVAQKAVTSLLGVCTLASGGWLVTNMYQGFMWHSANPVVKAADAPAK
jgi:hypothetical protein